MHLKRILITSILILLFQVHLIFAQADTMKFEGVKVIVPQSDKKKNNTCFIFSSGYQLAAWYKVPMIPEFPHNMVIDGNMKVKTPGWFAGFGIMKRTRSRFEYGILANYYVTTIPVARLGQRSTSQWVYENTDSVSYFTSLFEYDVNRVCKVISVRASFRYKIPAGKINFWGGVSPGTYSSIIEYTDEKTPKPFRTKRITSLGVNFEAGIDFPFQNKKGNELFMLSFFCDFSGPMIDDSMNNLFKPGWKYINTEKNYVVNPVRLGFAIGIP